jgi:hypothetical protein
VAATSINEEMKLAASHALAALAKEDVPDSVIRAYGGQPFKFGRNYVIPKPFDYRVLLWEAPAVAEAAIRTGVARAPYSSRASYVRELENRLSRTRQVMHIVFDQARLDPKRIVFPEGEAEKIVRAATGQRRPAAGMFGDRATIERLPTSTSSAPTSSRPSIRPPTSAGRYAASPRDAVAHVSWRHRGEDDARPDYFGT